MLPGHRERTSRSGRSLAPIPNTNFTWDQVDDGFAYRPIAVFGPMRDTPLLWTDPHGFVLVHYPFSIDRIVNKLDTGEPYQPEKCGATAKADG